MLVILKGLLLSLSQVLFTQGILLAYWECFVMLLYTALLCVACPWLHPYAHFLGVCCRMSLMFCCAMASWFYEHRAASSQRSRPLWSPTLRPRALTILASASGGSSCSCAPAQAPQQSDVRPLGTVLTAVVQ